MHTLLERARAEGAPIIEGEQVTFVWQGEHAPLLLGDFNHWGNLPDEPAPMTQVETGVWTRTLTFPRDAYIEYAYFTAPGDEHRVADPFNPRTIANGVGAYNHYVHMPDAPVENPLWKRVRGVKRGKVTRHMLDAGAQVVGGRRELHLYQPPTDDPVPLVVVWDGTDYLKRAHITEIVDNLIAQGRIRPVALAMIGNGKQARFIEYLCSEATVGMLPISLLPYARQHLRLIDEREQSGIHGVLGASMGGLMALYTAIRLPGIFGHVMSQSGAFRMHPDYYLSLWDYLWWGEKQPLRRIYMDCGQYEGLLSINREMHPLLVEKGYDVTYHEYAGGHNYTAWSHQIATAFETVYGHGT